LGRFWRQINFDLQFLSNRHKKHIFAKINLSPGRYLGGIMIFCPRKKPPDSGKKNIALNRIFQFQS
jgi:hypothetical protein